MSKSGSRRRVEDSGLIHDGTLREVGVATELRLLSVDDENETFQVDVLIHTHYIDKDFLQADQRAENGFERINFFEGFIPEITMVNEVDSQYDDFIKTTRINRQTGVVWTSFYNTIRVTESLELQKFPFDRQLFRVLFKSANCELRPWKIETKILGFPPAKTPRLGDDEASHAVACDLKQWYMKGFYVEFFPEDSDPASLTKGEFQVTIMAERDPQFYLINVFFIIYLIVLMNVCLVSLGTEDAANRNVISITLLLTLVAYKFVLMQGQPKIGYLTYMDRYVVTAFLFTISAVIENVFVAPLVKCSLQENNDCDEFLIQNLTEESRKADEVFQISFGILWTFLNLVVAAACLWPAFVRTSWTKVAAMQIGTTDDTLMRTNIVTNGNSKDWRENLYHELDVSTKKAKKDKHGAEEALKPTII